MMKTNILSLLLFAIVFTACNHIDPVKYNDKLVKYSNDGDSRVESFHSELAMAFDNDDLSTISTTGKEIIDSLNADITRINALEKPSGAEAFHSATVNYLESLIAYVKIASDEYGKITENTPESTLDSIDTIVDNANKESEAKLEKMIKAQEAFAKDKNMHLVN